MTKKTVSDFKITVLPKSLTKNYRSKSLKFKLQPFHYVSVKKIEAFTTKRLIRFKMQTKGTV